MVAVLVVGLFLLVFATGCVQVMWDATRKSTRKPVTTVVEAPVAPPQRRSQIRFGTSEVECVEFEDFELIKTSEQVLQANGW